MIKRLFSDCARPSLLLLPLALLGMTHLHAAERPTVADIETSASAYTLRPGVVIDPEPGLAHIMRPEGGIEALDLHRGTPRWTTTDGDLPLLVFGDLLFAMREATETNTASVVEIVALGRQDGRLRFATTAALPENTWARIDDGLGTQFTLRAWTDGASVRFGWSSSHQIIGGMASSTSTPVVDTGVFELRFADERLIPLVDAVAPPPPRPDVPSAQRRPGLPNAQFVSADQAHVLASERVADDRSFESYRWTIVASQGEDRLGSVRNFVSRAPFGVVGGRILFESRPHARRIADEMKTFPLAVRSLDLRNGQERWTRPVRDTSYTGPFPP